jgi:putative membrane protein
MGAPAENPSDAMQTAAHLRPRRRARPLFLWVLLAAQALTCAALAQQTDENRPRQSTLEQGRELDRTRTTQTPLSRTVTPQSFATQAAVIGQAEIELGELALRQTQDPGVRNYAQRMIEDHQAAAAKLTKIAGTEQLELPQALDAEHQALKEKLSELRGEAFDREYAKAMAKGHDKAVALFEAASQAAQLPSELREFAAATLPTLKQHMEMAHELHAKEGA